MCLFAYITGRRHYPINYNIRKLMLYMALALLLLFVGWNINYSEKILQQVMKEIPIIVFVMAVYFGERKKLKLSKN